jgi:hypothetical protein
MEMPLVYTLAKFKGRKGEVEVPAIANSGAELVVLTKELAEQIDPEPLTKEKVDVEVAGGIKLKSAVYLVEVEVKDPDTGERRRELVHAIILPDQDIYHC